MTTTPEQLIAEHQLNRDRLVNLATVLMAFCAIAITGLLARRELTAETSPPRTGPGTSQQANWRTFAAEGHVVGPESAQVTIVEFADFECPYCRVFHNYMDSLRADGGRDVKLVYRHYPLPSHRFAAPAARASECAHEQKRFEAMHNALYYAADSMGLVDWMWFAAKAGVPDLGLFEQCMRSRKPVEAIARDTTAGNRLGIRGTPTLLINTLRIDGVPPLDSLRAYIVRAKSESARSTP